MLAGDLITGSMCCCTAQQHPFSWWNLRWWIALEHMAHMASLVYTVSERYGSKHVFHALRQASELTSKVVQQESQSLVMRTRFLWLHWTRMNLMCSHWAQLLRQEMAGHARSALEHHIRFAKCLFFFFFCKTYLNNSSVPLILPRVCQNGHLPETWALANEITRTQSDLHFQLCLPNRRSFDCRAEHMQQDRVSAGCEHFQNTPSLPKAQL